MLRCRESRTAGVLAFVGGSYPLNHEVLAIVQKSLFADALDERRAARVRTTEFESAQLYRRQVEKVDRILANLDKSATSVQHCNAEPFLTSFKQEFA